MPDASNQLQLADISDAHAKAAFILLRTALDVLSGRITSYAIGEETTAELVLVAPNETMHPRRLKWAIDHSNQSVRYIRTV